MILSPEQVSTFFKAHWTVRKYKNFKMPVEHLDVILEAAQRAPTDATAQMYSFVRLTDPVLRKQIADLSTNPHIETASESFIICADVFRLEQILKTYDFEPASIPNIAIHFGIGDAVLAGQSMLIAAEMLGYRGCWIGGLINAPNEISELIQLPEGCFPFAALTIGVPDEEPVHRPRLPRNQVVHENTYRKPSAEELKIGAEQMASITARGNWAQTLARYFAKGGGMEAREVKMKEFLQKMIYRGK
ncbi:MAG: nitroreductase family protein [Bdellovibrio sp.]|nr:nitroreductase family protein [Bdellovibrio sp.]